MHLKLFPLLNSFIHNAFALMIPTTTEAKPGRALVHNTCVTYYNFNNGSEFVSCNKISKCETVRLIFLWGGHEKLRDKQLIIHAIDSNLYFLAILVFPNAVIEYIYRLTLKQYGKPSLTTYVLRVTLESCWVNPTRHFLHQCARNPYISASLLSMRLDADTYSRLC